MKIILIKKTMMMKVTTREGVTAEIPEGVTETVRETGREDLLQGEDAHVEEIPAVVLADVQIPDLHPETIS
jgi:hypothetical protein